MSDFVRFLTLTGLGLSLLAGAAMADTKDKKIALSNNYAGNSWRQAMLRSWDTGQVIAERWCASYHVVTAEQTNEPTSGSASLRVPAHS